MSSLLELLKQKKASIAAASGNRAKTIKPVEGTGRYRILPSWRGEGQFWHDFGQHFIKNSAGEITAIYMCTDKTYGRPCPVCDAIAQGTRAASDDSTMELLKNARASGRVLVNALHVDGPTPTEVKILELSPSAFAALLDISAEWEEAGESLFDAAKGKDILINRSGTGLKTKYTVQVAAKSVPLPAGVLSALHNLDDYVAQESADQQNRALNSVRAVSGLLPAPATTMLRAPAAPAGTDDDMYEAAPVPAKKAAPAAAPKAPVEDAVVKPAKAAAPAIASTGDAEIDSLLNDLGV